MIEINLLPGSGKKAKKGGGGGAKLNLGASLQSLRGKVRDPWLLGAIGCSVVAIAATYAHPALARRHDPAVHIPSGSEPNLSESRRT